MAKKTLPPLHLVTSDDELRPVLNHIEITDGIATATNGIIIAQLNLSAYSLLPDDVIKRLNGKLIHKDVWQLLIDADLIEVQGDIITYEHGGIKADINIACSLKFPDHASLIKSVANSLFDKKSFVCFNPKFISIASKLFPSENLICRFYEESELMVFFPSGEAKGYLAVAPIKITEEEAVIDFSLC